jgi:hypothetical protein
MTPELITPWRVSCGHFHCVQSIVQARNSQGAYLRVAIFRSAVHHTYISNATVWGASVPTEKSTLPHTTCFYQHRGSMVNLRQRFCTIWAHLTLQYTIQNGNSLSTFRRQRLCPFRVCKSMHHHTFKWINKSDAAISQVYCLSFKYSSTFGRPHAHHR